MDTSSLLAAVSRLSIVATGEFDAATLLRELCEAATGPLAVDGLGVMAAEAGLTRYIHATGPDSVGGLEKAQEVLQLGPCRDAVESGRPVVSADLHEDPRWGSYTDLVRATALRAVAAVPLVSRGQVWGTLDLYRKAPGAWPQDELAAARLLADVAVSFLVMASDRQVARDAQRQLAAQAVTDPLTSLPNRTLLLDRLTHALAGSERVSTTLAVVYLDLDGFKAVNDTLGHDAGDTVLTELAARMKATIRRGDTLARMSGDEFVLLCENLPDTGAATTRDLLTGVTDRLMDALASPVTVHGVPARLSASAGVAVATATSTTSSLLREADAAMYRAKTTGPGRVEFHDLDGAT